METVHIIFLNLSGILNSQSEILSDSINIFHIYIYIWKYQNFQHIDVLDILGLINVDKYDYESFMHPYVHLQPHAII